MSNKLRKILICGLGSIGRRYLRILKKNWPDLKIAVLRSGSGYSCDELKLIDYQTSNLRDSIKWGPQAAIISSPASLHVEQAITLGNSKVPCLIEKPLGTGNEDDGELDKLIQISETLPIHIGYILRHDPCSIFVKEKLKKNLLGRVVEADFHCGSWLPKWRSDVDYLKSVSANKELVIDQLFPNITGVAIAADNSTIAATFNEGVFNTVNASIFSDWNIGVVLYDTAWGTFNCMITAIILYYIFHKE